MNLQLRQWEGRIEYDDKLNETSLLIEIEMGLFILLFLLKVEWSKLSDQVKPALAMNLRG